MSSLTAYRQVRNETALLRNGAEVRLAGVSKSFGARQVLQQLDLVVNPGEFLAIVGRSGCGKSTLLRLIAGLATADSGTIDIDGKAIIKGAQQVRMLFQDSRLLPWKTVEQNVGIARIGDWKSQALSALGDVGLGARANDWPAVLSGGQKQRVALARALTSHPKVLLLDEPLGSLDALTRLEMQQLLERVWRHQEFTAILVTHDVAEAVRLADRIVLLEQGKITLVSPVSQARPRELKTTDSAAIEAQILARLLESGS